MHFKPIRFDLNHQSVIFVGKNWKSFENVNWIVKYSPTSFCGWLWLPESHMEKDQIFSNSLIYLLMVDSDHVVFLLSCARYFIELLFVVCNLKINLPWTFSPGYVVLCLWTWEVQWFWEWRCTYMAWIKHTLRSLGPRKHQDSFLKVLSIRGDNNLQNIWCFTLISTHNICWFLTFYTIT